jgi:hypothetical protein
MISIYLSKNICSVPQDPVKLLMSIEKFALLQHQLRDKSSNQGIDTVDHSRSTKQEK